MNETRASVRVTDDEVRALAADYLDTHSHVPYDPALKYAVKEEMEAWERRRDELSEDDPLYEASEAASAESERRWFRVLAEENGEREQLLSAIAGNFVAEGVWLEPRVIRAVNLVLRREYREWLVVDGVLLEDGAELPVERKARVSMAVRELAERELATIQ